MKLFVHIVLGGLFLIHGYSYANDTGLVILDTIKITDTTPVEIESNTSLNEKIISIKSDDSITQSKPNKWDWWMFVFGCIGGCVASVVASILYNIIFSSKMVIDDNIAKNGSGNNVDYDFLVSNPSMFLVLNVIAEASIVYYDQNNVRNSIPIPLIKNITPNLFRHNKRHPTPEDSSIVFTIDNAKNFNKEWKKCIKESSFKEQRIRLRVTSTHSWSMHISFVEKYFEYTQIRKGNFIDGKFQENK